MKQPHKPSSLLEMAQWAPQSLVNIAAGAQMDPSAREWAVGIAALGLAHLPKTGANPTFVPLANAGFDPNWRDVDGLSIAHHVLRQPESKEQPWRANYLAEMIDAGLDLLDATASNPNWTVYGGIVADPELLAGLRKRHEVFAILDAGRRAMLADITGLTLDECMAATKESVGPHHQLAWQQVMVVGMSEQELMQRSRSRLVQGAAAALSPMSARASREQAALLAGIPDEPLEQGVA